MDGVCQPGEPPCDALEEAGCTVTCTESTGGPICAKEVTDADADDHVSEGNTCSVESDKPRDDCDDSNAASYPGADEICDGLDNDCDGLDDFAEGAPLGGETRTIWSMSESESGHYPAVAWCDGIQHYVVVWATSQRLLAARVRPNGTLSGEVQPLLDDQMPHREALAACSGSILGVAWRTTTPSTSDTDPYRFARFDIGKDDAPSQIDAVPLALPLITGTPFGVAASEGGAWGIFGLGSGSSGVVYRVTAGGAIVPPPHALPGIGWYNAVAGSKSDIAVFYARSVASDTDVGTTFNWARYGGTDLATTLEPSLVVDTIPMASDGTTSIVGVEDGFFMVGRTRSQRVLVAKRTYAGGVGDCGPVEIADSLYPFSGDGEIRLATANNRAAFYVASSSGPQVFRLPHDCDQSRIAAGTRMTPLTAESVNSSINMVVGSSPSGHIAVWFSGLNLRVRAWGDAFCDTPP